MARSVTELWDEFLGQHGAGLVTLARTGFETARSLDGYLDRKLRFLAKSSFKRYLMLEDELAGRKLKDDNLGVHLEAAKAEIRELRALSTSQAAVIHEMRQQLQDMAARLDQEAPTRVVDWTERHRYGIRGEAVRGPPSFPAAQGQFAAQHPPTQQASQASVAGGGNQGQGEQGNGGRGQGGRGGGERGQGRNGGGRGGGWNGQGDQGEGNQGGQEGGQGYGRPRFDWWNAIRRHCGIIGHTIRFCQQRRDDELSGLIFTNMDGDIYDKFGKYIEPKTLGGVRQEALRRAEVGPTPPTMFRLWQEREDPTVRIEEIVEESEEVTQRLKAGTEKEESIVVESDDEELGEVRESAITILEKMEDLVEKAPPRREPEPERRKQVVEVPEEEEEDDDEKDERLRQQEDWRAELRARKRGAQEKVELSQRDSIPKRKKYVVPLEEGFDVERMVDRLLEGYNDLMNLKDILASAPRLRDSLKGRLSRRLVPNVRLSTILPREVEWTEAGTRMDWKYVACGLVDLVVRDQKCAAMVDTSAEMNIIRERDAIMLGLKVDRSDHRRLRASPMGRDDLPIRLEEGIAEEFIPAYERYMRDQGIVQEEWIQTLLLWTRRAKRPVARQIRDRASDWEDCQAQLRQAFRQPEPKRPEPRVKRRRRKERVENLVWRKRMEAKEVEWEKKLQDMTAAVERLSTTKVVDWTEQSRYDIQGEGMQGLFGQEKPAEPSQQEKLKKIFLEPAEAETKRKAEEGSFEFKTPTELASQQETPMPFEAPVEGQTQGPQPPTAK
ncbi:hypothetical protein CBR_g49964 [Chara braunii]|uniref:Peptidase A2 domain-containing protein n=1 Tax=Chara braunii TaxID=69332 RepID=A0A388K531_CHABU|nr:hypothetical protein CBR_g49964 [Chara braunii]|eukprot:GBG65168.1 hypothetical protein CBR_g49964 [Chara braunii]